MSDAGVLQRVPFLAALDPGELKLLAGTLRRRRYSRNEVICHRDDPGRAMNETRRESGEPPVRE